jgi:hypothetical protein
MAVSVMNSTVLVTGANGGLGTQFVHQALELGARKVYATARRPQEWNERASWHSRWTWPTTPPSPPRRQLHPTPPSWSTTPESRCGPIGSCPTT